MARPSNSMRAGRTSQGISSPRASRCSHSKQLLLPFSTASSWRLLASADGRPSGCCGGLNCAGVLSSSRLRLVLKSFSALLLASANLPLSGSSSTMASGAPSTSER